MSSSKPGVFKLSGEAKDFVFGNWPLLKDSLKIVFPLVLLINGLNLVGLETAHGWISYILILPSLYVYACYALTWHRNCLVGIDKANVVNPLYVHKSDWKFIGVFTLVTGLFSIYIFGVTYGLEFFVNKYGMDSYKYFGVGAIAAILIGMYTMIRISFLLPAQSVSVTLGFADIVRASRGMVWSIIGTIFIYVLLLFICAQIYTGILRIFVEVAAHGSEMSDIQGMIASFAGMIPIQLGVMLLVALYTVAISRAYKWGMENNSLT